MQIFRTQPRPFRLIIPSVCFMEAYSVFNGEQKRHQGRLKFFDEQMNEVKRSVTSSHKLVKFHLEQARTQVDDFFETYSYLFHQTMEALIVRAELIHPSAEILMTSLRRDIIIDDRTDNLILTCILDHAKNVPSETKAFLSENRKDFHDNDRARLALQEAGIKYFADASKFLQWHGARPEE